MLNSPAYTFVYTPETALNASTVTAETFQLQNSATGMMTAVEEVLYIPGENKILLLPEQENFVPGIYTLESATGLETIYGESYTAYEFASSCSMNEVLDGTVDVLSVRYYKNGQELYDLTGQTNFIMCARVVNNSQTEYKNLSYMISSSLNPGETIFFGTVSFDAKGFAEFEVYIKGKTIDEGEQLLVSFEPLV